MDSDSSRGNKKLAKVIGSIIAIIAIIIVIIVNVDEQSEELLYVIEVSRHGAREPTKLFNFTKDPSQNFHSTTHLLPLGKR